MVFEGSMREQVRQLLQRLLRARPQLDGDAAGEGLEDVVQSVDGSKERFVLSERVSRFLLLPGRDCVTAPGQVVELVIPVDRVANLQASTLRVKVGTQVIAERSASVLDTTRVVHRAQQAGLYPVRIELVAGDGHTVEPIVDTDPMVLQIIDDQPVIAFDAALVLATATTAALATTLVEAGATVIYFDLVTDDRTAAIRSALREGGFPPGAVLAHSQADFRTWGIDFGPMLLTATLRRLRAAGVPLAAVVSESESVATAAAQSGVLLASPRRIETEGQRAWLDRVGERSRELMGERQAAASDVARRLDSMTSTRAVPGNRCRAELDNRRARERLFEAIETARGSIHLQAYLVRDGGFTDQLAARLIRAARRGVRVRLMVDALYSVDGVLGATNAVVRGLTDEPNIEVVSTQPIASRGDLDPLLLKRRDHRKLVTIDGRIAFVSGRNLADEYYTGFDEIAITDWTPHERIPWLDAHLELHGPLVASIQEAFVGSWEAHHGPGVERDSTTFPELEPCGTCSARLVLHNGVEDAAAMLAYEAIIDSAEDHIYVINDFPIVASLLSAFRRALGRSVRIDVLTGSAVARRGDGSFFKGPLYREAFEYMTKHRLHELIQAGARAWEYATPPHELIVCRGDVVRPYVHAKVVCVDGKVASIGSANLDAAASYWEREANVVVEDSSFVEAVERQIAALLSDSRLIDVESGDWRREATLREIAGQLWPDSLYA